MPSVPQSPLWDGRASERIANIIAGEPALSLAMKCTQFWSVE
jgi:hypothetical protein